MDDLCYRVDGQNNGEAYTQGFYVSSPDNDKTSK